MGFLGKLKQKLHSSSKNTNTEATHVEPAWDGSSIVPSNHPERGPVSTRPCSLNHDRQASGPSPRAHHTQAGFASSSTARTFMRPGSIKTQPSGSKIECDNSTSGYKMARSSPSAPGTSRTQSKSSQIPRSISSRSTNENSDLERYRESGLFANAHGFAVTGGSFTGVSHHQTINVQLFGERLGIKVLFEYISKNALYDSASRFEAPKCDRDTRVEVVNEIMGWIRDKESPTRILCMTGPAGSGKSTIKQTIAGLCIDEGILAASFFFSNSDESRNSKETIIATIAYQLSLSIREVQKFISRAVLDDPAVFCKSLKRQIEILLVEPVRAAESQLEGQTQHWPHAILIDGLDECHGEDPRTRMDHQTDILRAIHSSFIDNDLPFRIFLSSRPEYAIRTALTHEHKDLAYHIVLDNKYNPNADILLYLQRWLPIVGIKADEKEAKAGKWPTPEDVEALVENASGQFIYAATVVKFISQRNSSPVRRLQLILSQSSNLTSPRNPLAPLDLLYISALTLAQDAINEDADDDPISIVNLLSKFSLVQAWNSALGISDDVQASSITFLEGFPFFSPGGINRTLTDMHALIDLSNNEINFHHKSFADFLSNPSRSGHFYIDKTRSATELVVELSKKNESGDTYYKFDFHPTLDFRKSSLLWWWMLCESTLDHEVYRILEEFNFEGWLAEHGNRSYHGMHKVITELSAKIEKQNDSSSEWLAIQNRLKGVSKELNKYGGSEQ